METSLISKADYEAQLAAGFRWMRFEGALEHQFRDWRCTQQRAQLRWALGIGLLFGCSFPMLDFFLGETGFSSPAVPLRAAFSQPLILAMLLMTWSDRMQRWLAPMGVAVSLSIAISSLTMATVVQLQDLGTPFTGFVMLTMYIYLFLGLSFWPAVATSAGILVLVLAGFAVQGVPAGVLIYNSLFLVFANLIGATGLYNLEYNQRMNFLEAGLLTKLASIDALTGLANREQFARHYEQVWRDCDRQCKPLSVALVDVDHFKAYNDSYGHQAGDQVLSRIAGELRSVCRRPMDLAARYGGEEFVLLLPGAKPDHAHLLLSELIRRIEALNIEHTGSPAAPRVTVSAGLASVLPHETDRSEEGILQLADEALYKAKDKGRNRVIVANPDQEESLLTGIFNRSRDGQLVRSA